jgi:ATP-dependent RNA helicase DDX54/DBP10
MVQKLQAHSSTHGVRGIVLSPTRELAVQTFRFAKDFAKFTDLNIISILGGDPIEAQFEALASRPDLIVATPGRLMHHLREISTFKLNHVQVLIFDEADRLFEMGFAEQLNEIVRECPTERQTLLFSATMPKALVQFSRAGLRDPQLIRLDTDSQLSEELRLAFFTVRSNEKMAAFLYLVRKIIPENQMTIVFAATRHHSELLHAMLERIRVSSTIVYGTMDQDARSQHLKDFRNGAIRYLIVTDLAARGIDVPLLNNVINFHFPPSPKLFVHRCGRAARNGRIGYAFSLVEPEEMAFMVDIHTYLGKNLDACDTNTHALDGSELFETAGSTGSASNTTSFGSAATEGMVSYTLETMTPEMVRHFTHCYLLVTTSPNFSPFLYFLCVLGARWTTSAGRTGQRERLHPPVLRGRRRAEHDVPHQRERHATVPPHPHGGLARRREDRQGHHQAESDQGHSPADCRYA